MPEPLLLLDLLSETRPDGPPEEVRVPQHLEDRRTDELFEADHRGDGVSRQADDRDAPQRAEGERPPRLHGDLPELHAVSLLLHDLLDQVVVPDGDAAGGDDQIGPHGGPEFRDEILPAVPGDADLQGNGAALPDEGGERIAVAADDLPFRRGLRRSPRVRRRSRRRRPAAAGGRG